MLRLWESIENLIIILLIFVLGPALILTGLGISAYAIYYFALALPYIVCGLGLWLILKGISKAFWIDTSIPEHAKKAIFTVKHNGQDIPIGIIVLCVVVTLILLPILAVATIFFFPPWIFWTLMGLLFIGGSIKGKKG
jgi:hypothetical protein